MTLLLLGMRLIHIVGGVFWVGTIMSLAFYVGPSIGDAGPDGGKVMRALMRRGFLNVVPVVAVLTILAGFWLYWFRSMAGGPTWMGSRAGMTYGTGAVLALVAFGIGMAVMRASTLRAAALMQGLTSVPDAERPGQEALIGALRRRAARAARVVAVLLVIAVALMAIARYV